MNLFSELNQGMVKYRFRPNRKMAQLFIIEESVLEKMVELAELSPKDVVLEIGAGTGFLTRQLQKKCKVVAVELDDNLFRLLSKELPEKNLELLHGNFLDLTLPAFNKVASLPPYTISSKIMLRLFELKPELCVLVFQKEYIAKLLAEPGFMEYNAMSVLTHYYFDAEMVSTVPAKFFFPKPSSDSAIVKLKIVKRKELAFDEMLFRQFIKSVFRFQNKNLENATKNSLPFMKVKKEDSEKILKKFASNKLAKQKVNLLSCDEFVALFNQFFSNKK